MKILNNKKIKFFIFLQISLLLALILSGCLRNLKAVSISHTTPAEPKFTRVVLNNGLTIIAKEFHGSNVVSAQAWIKAGSRNETEENNGISHFIEHLLFKGTTKRAVGEINQEVESMGGTINAATSKDFTYYHITIAGQYLNASLDVLVDILMNSSFDPVEIERERKVVLEEIKRQNDNPQAFMWKVLAQTSYLEHPYGRAVLGTKENVEQMSRETIVDYYQKHYVPNNITIVVTGDFETDKVIKEIKKISKDFIPKPLPEQSIPEEPVQKDVRKKVIDKKINQSYLGLAWSAPNIDNEDNYAMDVLLTILSSGRSSRLYQQIKEEKRLASTIGAGYLTQKDLGSFAVYAQFNKIDLNDLEEAILEELEKIKYELVTVEEFNKAVTLLETSFIFSDETPNRQAYSMGYAETIKDVSYHFNYLDNIQKVTLKDIQTVAQKYLGKDNYTEVVLLPEE